MPAACVRGLSPPTKPPRLSVAVLSYLPSEVSRLRATACHYASLGAVVGKVLVQWNGPAPAPVIDCAHVPPDKGDPKFSVDVEVVAFERNTLLNRYASPEKLSQFPAVLLQDDDVRYSRKALRAFSAVHVLASYFSALKLKSAHAKQLLAGYIANAIVILYYAAPLSTMAAVLESKSASSIHGPLVAVNGANGALWLVYGLTIGAPIKEDGGAKICVYIPAPGIGAATDDDLTLLWDDTTVRGAGVFFFFFFPDPARAVPRAQVVLRYWHDGHKRQLDLPGRKGPFIRARGRMDCVVKKCKVKKKPDKLVLYVYLDLDPGSSSDSD